MWIKLEIIGEELKVSWNYSAGTYIDPYFIGRTTFQSVAENVRNELKNLSEWARSPDPEQRWKGLTALAKVGSDLRYQLFNDRKRQDDIKKLKTCIAEDYDAGDHDLAIQADPSVSVPWGLLYDGDVPSQYVAPASPLDPDEISKQEMAAFGGFWALKFRIAATPSGNGQARSRMKRPRKSFGLLSLVNKDVEKQIEADLGLPRYEHFCKLLSPPVGVAYDLECCRNLIDQSEQEDILFHFLGHHRKDELDLGSGGKLNYTQFSQLLDELTDETCHGGPRVSALLFVNGCKSAVGDEDFSGLSEMKRPSLYGIIATESLVRRTDAAQFGYRFLDALIVRGQTIADTMEELHHDPALWPESLLYGCYARPEYCIEPLPPPQPAASPKAPEAGVGVPL